MSEDMTKDEVTTNEIMEFLQEHMLTRDEAFGTFATKEDLKAFATKEDLRQELSAYATKEDLNELRDDMVTGFDQLITMYRRTDEEMVAHHARMDRIEEGLGEVREFCGLPKMAG